MPTPHRPSARLLALTALLTIGLVGISACSSSRAADSSTTTSTTAPKSVPQVEGGADDAAFRGPGPFDVGVTTLQLPDRPVEVWYPARAGSTAGVATSTYSQLDALPANLAAAAPALLPADIPASVLTVTMTDTYRDVPASPDGPFPLVLFSHGFGSFRLDASALLRGIASWGFVVAAPEHIERDRAAILTDPAMQQQVDENDPAAMKAAETRFEAITTKDVSVLVDTIGLVGAAGGPLQGLADTSKVGAVGHSAGGRAALTSLSEPQIKVAVGWAAAGRADIPAPDKPSMNIAARQDILVPLPEIKKTYAGMAPPKRLVVIKGAGHNSFTDICLAVKDGNDLIGLARRIGLQIPDNLLAGGQDGCAPGSLDTKLGWEITQNYTVAELRNALGVDTSGTGLGQGTATAFPPARIKYRQALK